MRCLASYRSVSSLLACELFMMIHRMHGVSSFATILYPTLHWPIVSILSFSPILASLTAMDLLSRRSRLISLRHMSAALSEMRGRGGPSELLSILSKTCSILNIGRSYKRWRKTTSQQLSGGGMLRRGSDKTMHRKVRRRGKRCIVRSTARCSVELSLICHCRQRCRS